ncbi:hypothetical protein AURDEDRAFT_115744 [Auricularia subglabra TFB-10046 SS5]|uniref:Uncharacterized protein n=1 Tax=Auricularia subglabra (strain TFB-10046 / SS5) TaxID=717982 RepID=J0WY87_AURST|nr:hypothetical protein AURDEDRAFT_115744 [Auricularia subglabra TFB-10046 SS5]
MSAIVEKQLPAVLAMSMHAPPPERTKEHAHGGHCACHSARKRRLALVGAGIAFVTLLVVLALSFTDPSVGVDALFSGGWKDGSLLRRQVDNGSGSGSDDSPFVKNKLYLIVLFVGLFLCLVAAVMLAAWCCRGAFQNPLCCPCYCCALCGGLACIECISCGLCAEAADQFV